MKVFSMLSVATVGLGVTFVYASSAHALLINGDFSLGLTGWTPYTTANGVIGMPAVTSFDVTGLGASPAARLQVGQEVFSPGLQSGGGLSQTFTGPEGDYSFTYDFASLSSEGNSSGGLFSLIFNGTVLDSFDTALVSANTPVRGSLSGFLAGVEAGTHEIRIQSTRPFTVDPDIAELFPVQYFDNVVATATHVPGPLPLLGVGAAFGFSRKLRKRIKGSKLPVESTIN
ncbi:hypothetical protein KBY97_03820 [Synechococcus sp. ATX 2A4]|uniref:hypothetical protein n=1 Tax=Synechococcus sp. ATX 2A4 TaxID=2823727 RepID=UPI0020CEDD79|nr:hypothetical protein [Synechococcus sp. ATX 2A4]MCP9884258.1 hypothetical protein [Synechococcus sp. ATX 2A4]